MYVVYYTLHTARSPSVIYCVRCLCFATFVVLSVRFL